MKNTKTIKCLLFFCCLLAAMCIFTLAANAEIVDSGECGDNLIWALDDEGTLTISGTGTMRNYSIWTGAPWGITIQKAVLQSGVTSIGESAFSGCMGLTSVTIPDSVTGIGDYAFFNCTGLPSMTIPNNVRSIGESAFSGCTGLTSVTIPDRVTSIGDCVFYNCTGLPSVTIPNSVTSIGDYAFYRCTGLTSVTIPNSVTSIGDYAFYRCTGLTGVTIPDNVTSIGWYAFYGCTSLISVTIPNSITIIGERTFSECTSMTNVIIPDSVTSIGEYAFLSCTGLTSVTIPGSVTSIGEGAFYECTGLTSVTIPKSVTEIEESAFKNDSMLQTIYYAGSEADWKKIEMEDGNSALLRAEIIFGQPEPHTDHTWDDGKVTKDATCTEKGEKIYTCTVCKATKTEEIAATGHKPVTDAAVTATCMEDGKTEGSHCSVCNAVIKAQTAIKSTGHKWDNGKITKEAAEDTEGIKTFICTVCGAAKTESIPKLEPQKPEFDIGDVDGDGKLTSADARLALRASVGLEPDIAAGSGAYLAADADGDGEVTSGDARLILRASVGLEDASKFGKKA